MENISPPAIMTRKTSGLGVMPGDMMHPTTSSTVQLMSALTTPERVLPRMTDDILTGHSSSSSKLM